MSVHIKIQLLAAEALRIRELAKQYGSDGDKVIALALNEAALTMFVGSLKKMGEPITIAPVALAKLLLTNIAEISHEIGDAKSAEAAEQFVAKIDEARR